MLADIDEHYSTKCRTARSLNDCRWNEKVAVTIVEKTAKNKINDKTKFNGGRNWDSRAWCLGRRLVNEGRQMTALLVS